MKLVISVGIASYPISSAGNTWNSLNWALGFRELGWDVWIVENLNGKRCIDSNWKPALPAESANVRRWKEIVSEFQFENRSTLLIDDDAADLDAFRDFSNEAELFINLSGHLKTKVTRFEKALKVYQDGDPAFTQIWASKYGCDMNFENHDRFVTAGLRLGQPGSFAPTCGIEWIPTFPPVVLKYWPVKLEKEFDRFTSVAHWIGYSSCEWEEKWFHGKREEFTKFIELPGKVSRTVELAVNYSDHKYDFCDFEKNGWKFVEASKVCKSLHSYGNYIADSSAEFGVAKGGYVLSQAGWFSDRSVCYAASGKPLIVQDTGLGSLLPQGEGYHSFSTLDEAVLACEKVISDFPNQQRRSRLLAEEFFDSKKVLSKLLDRLF